MKAVVQSLKANGWYPDRRKKNAKCPHRNRPGKKDGRGTTGVAVQQL
jgi:hypothetical protein